MFGEGRSKVPSWQASEITQRKGAGGLDQGNGSCCRAVLNSGYVWNVDRTRYVCGLNVGYERKKSGVTEMDSAQVSGRMVTIF